MTILWREKVPQGWNGAYPRELQTIPEKNAWRKTSSFLETCEYLAELMWHTELMHIETMFVTEQRRGAPLVILSNPRVSTPEEARRSGKPVVYLQGGIHPDEAEGKEAVLLAIRELTLGGLRPLLDEVIVAACPDFNPDGNDAWSMLGYCGGTPVQGQRANSKGLDLNRDAIKLESPNMQGLCRNLLNRWDPHVSLDLHCMGAVRHGYALLYAPSYTPTAHPGPRGYTMETLFPAVRGIVRDRYSLEVYTHAEWDEGEWPPTTWDPKKAYYTVEAKYIANAIGLRNRMSILTETPSQVGFEKRTYSSYAYACALLEYAALRGAEIREVCRKADEETVKAVEEKAASGTLRNWVAGEYASRGKTSIYAYRKLANRLVPGTSYKYRGPEDYEPELVGGVEDLTLPVGTRAAVVPRGYLIPEELVFIAEKLRIHGVRLEQLKEPTRAEGEEYVVDSFGKEAKGDHTLYPMTELRGGFVKSEKMFPAGTWCIDLAQPLANLAFYALEPEVQDSLAGWGLLDGFLRERGAPRWSVVYPVFKYLRLG